MSGAEGGGAGRVFAPILLAAGTAVLPAWPELALADRDRVEEETGRFLVAQLFAMPSYLLVPVLVALAAFEWHTLARHGRRFSRLGRPERARAAQRWAASRIAPKRDLLKLIRSCTLFFYLDHVAVRAALDAKGSDGGA